MFRYNDIHIGDLFFTANHGHWAPGASNFTSNGHVFTGHEQVYIAAQACGAYHLTLVMSQVWLIFNFTLIVRKYSFYLGLNQKFSPLKRSSISIISVQSPLASFGPRHGPPWGYIFYTPRPTSDSVVWFYSRENLVVIFVKPKCCKKTFK
jgi:hypothetical protein